MKKRAAAAKHQAERKEREVVARRDERKLQVGAIKDEREHQVVDVALVARQKDERPALGRLANPLEPCLVDLETVVDAVDELIERHVERPNDAGLGLRLELAQHRVGARGQSRALFLAFARQVLDDRLQLDALDDLAAHAVVGLAHRSDDRAAFALELAQQRIGEPAGERAVVFCASIAGGACARNSARSTGSPARRMTLL